MAVKKKTATRKKATVKKKTTVKKTAVKKKSASRKKAAVKKKTAAKKATVKKKPIHIMDEMEVKHEDEPLLIHDPLAMIAGDGMASGDMVDEESSLLSNDPFAMIAEGGEEAEQHFGFRTQATTDEPEPEQPPPPSEVNEMNETEQTAVQHVIDLGSDLTIADVESKKIELSHILTDALPVKLNGEELEQIDGAGLQLLAVLFKNAAKNNLEISWDKVSSTLMDAVKLVGLIELLNMQDIEVEDDGEGTAWGLF